MNRMATRVDWQQLSDTAKHQYAAVIDACIKHSLSCRCEMLDGRDFSIRIAPGLSAGKYWVDRLDIDLPKA